ncbi:hypothetical protein GCM10010497_43260 [Streptomyces cinereoruber]|uniref:Uncharacterized protein n=2 Tax=Streptomyces cinereoruber TaxID=67260 RepID=A0AAV4KM95_9ACTN|nr:hypothetical protein [Streptomyces cinereoruber]GGR35798.1 hypothetical protein GCM10010497_43260 [Streptomyces cinereoruber]
MSFEEEWAGLKEAALARRQAAAQMQLNQAPTGGDRPGSLTGPGDGYSVNAASLDGSSHLLMEIAGLLYEGRMDGENATQARMPRAHADVAAQVDMLARFAKDQYGDMVALLASLSTKLKSAGNNYTTVDRDVQGQMNAMLDCGRFVPPENR